MVPEELPNHDSSSAARTRGIPWRRWSIVLHRDVTSFGPGQHSVDLDRQGDLAPGVYVIRLSQADRAERRKIAIIR